MRVLLTNPPAYFNDNHRRHFVNAGSRWSFSIFVSRNMKEHYLPYPFSLGYVSALLKHTTNASVKGVDACALDMDNKDFIRYARQFDPDILLIDVPTISFPLTMQMLRELKETVGCKIVLAGGHVTSLADEVMSQYDFVDYCLLAEYIHTAKALIDYEMGVAKALDGVKGIAYRQNGGVKINLPETQRFNLDDLPYPDRVDFPIRLYHDFEIAGRPSAQMLTSLGCPYKCSFCMPVRVMFQDAPFYRKRAPSKLVDEMIHVRDEYGAKSVYFDDDTFAVDRLRLRAFCDEITQRKLDTPWAAMGDITLDRMTLERLAQAGCVGVKFGVETASVETIQAIRKNFLDHEKVKQFVKWCRDLGIWSHATYIVGLPGDKKEDILRTIKFAKELNSDSVQFSIATPFPGTPFYEEAKAKGWLVSDDWTQYDGANYSVLSYPWLAKDEIEDLHRLALRDWYLNTLIHEAVQPRRLQRIIRSGSMLYATRKTLSHLRGTL